MEKKYRVHAFKKNYSYGKSKCAKTLVYLLPKAETENEKK